MSGPSTPPLPFSPLHVRWLLGAWRRSLLLQACTELDALQRDDRVPAAGEPTDTAGRALLALAGAPSNAPRAFAIRSWSDHQRAARGRSPEYWLLSCRLFDDGDTAAVRSDAEAIAAAVETLRALNLTPAHARVRISHRDAVRSLLLRRGVPPNSLDSWFPVLHRAGKMSNDDFVSAAIELGMEAKVAVEVLRVLTLSTPFEAPTTQLLLSEQAGGRGPEYFKSLFAELRALGVADWCVLNLGIVRAGSHHTGMVFEIHDAGGRARSIVGGGRSVIAFEGRDLHAVGFDIGDAPILALLRETGLLPNERELAERLDARPAVYVVAADSAEAIDRVVATVVALRRAGIAALAAHAPAPSPQAARAAMPAGARHIAFIEPSGRGPVARLLNIDTGLETPPRPLDELPALLGARGAS